MRALIAASIILVSTPGFAASPDVGAVIDDIVLPGYSALASEAAGLAAAAQADCDPESVELRGAFNGAFDAWIAVSHMRFGPSETDNRAFALAFWPDPRGSTPGALTSLIRDEDPIASDPEAFQAVSVAARGFYALEFLLYDPAFRDLGAADYRCALIQAITTDIDTNALLILNDWENSYADEMRTPGGEIYRSDSEAAQQLFTALATGLEFTADARLGRPLGSFDRPRPNRAEARRSGRSLRHVVISLEANRALAAGLSGNDAALDDAFDRAIVRAMDLEDPVLAGVSDPQGRFRVESLKQSIDDVRQVISGDLGPKLGVAAGFNSMDGD